MSNVIRLASNEVVEARKKDAETAAAQNGHKLGNWTFDSNNPAYPRWKAACQNRGCFSQVSLNPAVNGIWTGITITSKLAQCPYDKKVHVHVG